MLSLLKKLTESKTIEEADEILRLIDVEPEQRDQLWNVLDVYFENSSFEQEYQARSSAFCWYTILTWKRLAILNEAVLLRVVSSQVPVAVVQNVDVGQQLFWYLRLWALTEDEMQSLYIKIREVFLESKAIVGLWQNKAITVSEFAKEYKTIYRLGDDTLEKAQFVNKLKQVMFPENESYFINIEPEEGVARFLELLDFFETTESNEIWQVVNDLFSMVNQAQNKNIAGYSDSSPIPEFIEKDNVSRYVELNAKVSSQQIKSQIESEFPKNEAGEFQDIEAVLNKLQELSGQYNNPEIANLLYFDEQDAQFKWNI